jgi:hypothetical protein
MDGSVLFYVALWLVIFILVSLCVYAYALLVRARRHTRFAELRRQGCYCPGGDRGSHMQGCPADPDPGQWAGA